MSPGLRAGKTDAGNGKDAKAPWRDYLRKKLGTVYGVDLAS